MESSAWREQYTEARPKFEKLTRKLLSLLEDIFEREDVKASFEGRTKDIESFEGKITRTDKSYTDPLAEITDLCGVRVILYSLRDVKRVAEIIAREFHIDQERSVNKFDNLAPDRFGYLSQHYIVKINDSRAGLFEWEEVSQLWAEIQVRTVLQHAWAAVEHFLVYKNKNDVPKLIRRRLFRLSALFELADEELDQLVSEINEQARQYKNELNEGNTKIEMNIDSLRTYIETSYEPKYWAQYLTENVGVRVEKDDWGDLSRDIEIANYFGLKFIDDVNSLLANAHGWGEIFFWNYYESVFKFFGVSSGEVSSVTNAPLTYLMIASHAEKITRALLDKEFGMLSPELLESALKARGIKSEVKD